MKLLKKIIERIQLKRFIKEESAQGMTEYILLIVVVVGLAYTFRNKIKETLSGKMEDVKGGIQGFEVDTTGQ